MCPIEDEQDFISPNVPKVISTLDGRLLYMSRAPVPTGKNMNLRAPGGRYVSTFFQETPSWNLAGKKVKTRLEGMRILKS